MRTILFDGDVAAYQIGFGTEKAVEWPGGMWTLHVDSEAAGLVLDNFLAKLMLTLEGDELIVVLSDDDGEANFRLKLAADYKANRKGKRKPLIHPWLRQYMKDGYTIFQRDTLEADDVLGILMTSKKIVRGERICVSIDKDLMSVPGLHYNTNHPERGIVTVTSAMADYQHMFQTLTGDQADNYPGLPGCGPVMAARILNVEGADADWMWGRVVAAYRKKGFGKEEALRQARIARILRNTDYNFKTKEVILWTP